MSIPVPAQIRQILDHYLLIPPQSGAAFSLVKGQTLEVVDIEGQQVADLFCIDLSHTQGRLSSGRSIDYNDSIRLTTGHRLFAQNGEPLMEIMDDTCGIHDFLLTPCSLQMFKMLDPTCVYHPSCQENLESSLKDFGVLTDQITTTFNIFMNVPIHTNGSLKVQAPISRAGDRIRFLALKDLIVGLTACADEATNAGRCKPIRYRTASS